MSKVMYKLRVLSVRSKIAPICHAETVDWFHSKVALHMFSQNTLFENIYKNQERYCESFSYFVYVVNKKNNENTFRIVVGKKDHDSDLSTYISRFL